MACMMIDLWISFPLNISFKSSTSKHNEQAIHGVLEYGVH